MMTPQRHEACWHLYEAAEATFELIEAVLEDIEFDDYGEVNICHIYHHLNSACNAYFHDSESLEGDSQEAFHILRQFPEDISILLSRQDPPLESFDKELSNQRLDFLCDAGKSISRLGQWILSNNESASKTKATEKFLDVYYPLNVFVNCLLFKAGKTPVAIDHSMPELIHQKFKIDLAQSCES